MQQLSSSVTNVSLERNTRSQTIALLYKMGPLPIISMVLTPLFGVLYLQLLIYMAFWVGFSTRFIAGRVGPLRCASTLTNPPSQVHWAIWYGSFDGCANASQQQVRFFKDIFQAFPFPCKFCESFNDDVFFPKEEKWQMTCIDDSSAGFCIWTHK